MSSSRRTARAVRDSVTRYIDHLQDRPWVESLVAQHGITAILQGCVDVLDEQDPGEVNEVTTLLRDLGIRGIIDDELVTSVRKLMPASVLPALRPLLGSPVLQLRMTAIYTLGKLSFSSEAKSLREIFPAYFDKDPFCLARLLFELAWLGDRRGARARLNRIIAHKSHLVRWSALGYLGCSGTPSGPDLRLKIQWLEALSVDPVPVVRDEARHQLRALELEVAGRKAKWLPKARWQKQRRALDKAEPASTFSALEVRFLNEMARTGQADYALDELASFVRTLAGST